MTKPAVVLIGAYKGGVGKTTVARTLLDFLAQHQIRTRAFDTEMPRGTLKRFHPDITDIVDINHVPDQMRIVDGDGIVHHHSAGDVGTLREPVEEGWYRQP